MKKTLFFGFLVSICSALSAMNGEKVKNSTNLALDTGELEKIQSNLEKIKEGTVKANYTFSQNFLKECKKLEEQTTGLQKEYYTLLKEAILREINDQTTQY